MKLTAKNALRGAACAALLFLTFPPRPAYPFNGLDIPQVRKMAEAGDADAQSKLGVLYSSGVGLPMDKKEAVKWYRKSSAQGHPLGQWNLAFMYVKGEGVETDYQKARLLFREAAEGGFAKAQYDLGMMMLQGLGGPQERAEAEKWFRKAAEQGDRAAKKMLQELGGEG